MRRFLLALLFPLFAWGQWSSPPSSGYSTLNTFLAALAASTTASSDPGTCTQGKEFYWNTATTRLRFCVATNTWADVPTGGVPVLISTSGPVTDPGGQSVYQFNNASGALQFNLPAGVAGMQRCYRDATGKSGAITVAVTTSNAIDLNGANGTTSTGTLVSGGALGDAVCLVSDAANHWYAYVQKGTWTNN
jgi:hypothetical protein